MLSLQAGFQGYLGRSIAAFPDTAYFNYSRTFRYADSGMPPLSMPINGSKRIAGLLLDGQYALNVYAQQLVYLDGQYSLALSVYLDLAETLTFSDSYVPAVSYDLALADSVTLTDTLTNTRTAYLALSESITFTDTPVVNATFNLILSESLILSDSVSTNDVLLAYVINANTFAVSTYENFNFKSFAKIGNTYYGAQDDGIYELTGDDDNGAQIDAEFTLGQLDFGSDSLKRMQNVYIGIRQNGDLILKVTTDAGDTNYYTMTQPPKGTLHTVRRKLGLGVKSRYWQMQIVNVDGADFTADSITFYPLVLSRRITGA